MKITTIQRWIMIVAAMLCAVAMLFPPWLYTYDFNNASVGGHHLRPAGHHYILSPPSPETSTHELLRESYGVRIDGTGLAIECLFVLAAASAAFVFFSKIPAQETLTTKSSPAGGGSSDRQSEAAKPAEKAPKESVDTMLAAWIEQGLKLADIQKRLESECGLRATYLELRQMVDALKLKPQDPMPSPPSYANVPAPYPVSTEPSKHEIESCYDKAIRKLRKRKW